MFPVLFEIGRFTVHSYGVMLALGFIISMLLVLREAPQLNYTEDFVLETAIITLIAGVVGARIAFVLLEWTRFSAEPWRIILDIRAGGLAFHGAIAGAILALFLYCRYRRVSFPKTADFYAPYLALGYAFARFGCFLNGCCFGKISTLPWAVVFPAVDDALRHPTQLYASAAGLIIFFTLLFLRRFSYFKGYLAAMFFVLYSVYRFLNEFLRAEGVIWLWQMTAGQVVSLVIFFLAATLLIAVRLLKGAEDS